MPTQTYTYHTPDGKSIDVQSNHPLAPDEVRQVFKAAGVDLKLPEASPTSMINELTSSKEPTDESGQPASPPSSLVKAVVNNPMLQGAAHPQSLGDIMALLLPNFAGQSLQLGGEAMASGVRAHPEMATGPLGKFKAGLMGVAERWRGSQPLTAEERIASMLGDRPPVPPPAPAMPTPIPAEADAVDRALAEARANRAPAGPSPTLRKAGSVPSVSDTLKGALEEAGAPNPAKGTTPPPPTTTPMGKPSITAEQYAQGERAAAAQPQPAPKPTTGKADKFAEIPDNPDAEEVVDRMYDANGGKTPGNGTGGPKAIEDAIAELRRKYGANRIGKAVNPKAPEAGTGTVLRADASQAPSAMPDIAQKAVLRDLRTGTSSNPAATARAVEQLLKEYSRNKGPANSDVARELADLLKQHGFDTGIK